MENKEEKTYSCYACGEFFGGPATLIEEACFCLDCREKHASLTIEDYKRVAECVTSSSSPFSPMSTEGFVGREITEPVNCTDPYSQELTAFEYLLKNPEEKVYVEDVKYQYTTNSPGNFTFMYDSGTTIKFLRGNPPIWEICEQKHLLKLCTTKYIIVEEPQKPEEKRKLEEDIESKIGEIENSLFFIKKSVEENRPCGFFGVLQEEVEDLRKMIEEFLAYMLLNNYDDLEDALCNRLWEYVGETK